MGVKKVWLSNIARNLVAAQNASCVEDAVAQLVDHKLSMFGGRSNLDLPMVASIVGIDHNFRYVDMEQSARLVPREDKYVIEVNKKHHKTRQRFSIGHEIGHRMLYGYKLTGVKARHPHAQDIEDAEEEDLCDLIAARLLNLTPEYLRPILQSEGLSFETLERISDKFNVSFEAAVRALIECCDVPAAILYCLPLTTTRSQNAFPTFVLKRYYISEIFPVTPNLRMLMLDITCLKRAFLAAGIVRMPETLVLNGVNPYRFECWAKRMFIYSESRSEQGVVMLVTQPQPIS